MIQNPQLRILMLSADFSLPPYGGIATHIAGLSHELVSLGHQVTLVVPAYGHEKSREEFCGIEVVFLGLGGGPRFLRYARRLYVFRKALRKIITDKQALLVHVHDLLVSPPAVRPLGKKLPVIFTNHTSYYTGLSQSLWGRLILRRLVGRPDGIITVSPVLLDKSQMHRPTHLELIPSGVDTELFRPQIPDDDLCNSLGLKQDDNTILFVGRFKPVKGLPHLFEAISVLQDDIPNLKLLMAGSGSATEEGDLARKISEFGIGDMVIFLGRISQEELPAYYALARVVVLPSLMEATSIAGLEAMACEKPLVGTEVGGLPIIIDHGKTGLLIPPGDSVSLAVALKKILLEKDYQKKMGKAARERVEQQFTWREIAKRTVDFYRRVISDHRSFSTK